MATINMRAPTAGATYQVGWPTNASYTANSAGLITNVASQDVGGLVAMGAIVVAGPPQQVAAAGATQGAAPVLANTSAVITTCTASARGVRLPTPVSGQDQYLGSACTQGTKIYPHVGGHIGTGATNVAAVQTGLKAYTYKCYDGVHWIAQKGA